MSVYMICPRLRAGGGWESEREKRPDESGQLEGFFSLAYILHDDFFTRSLADNSPVLKVWKLLGGNNLPGFEIDVSNFYHDDFD